MTRVCLRLGFAPGPYPDLASLPDSEHDVLELIDAALQLRGSIATAHGEIDDYPDYSNGQLQRDLLQRLDNTLRHGRVAWNQLEHRVTPPWRRRPNTPPRSQHQPQASYWPLPGNRPMR
jgi:hypothetical protein